MHGERQAGDYAVQPGRQRETAEFVSSLGTVERALKYCQRDAHRCEIGGDDCKDREAVITFVVPAFL